MKLSFSYLVLLLLLVSILFPAQMAAQPGPEDLSGDRLERIEAAKKAFLIERLSLTEAEQAGFFPLLKAHEEERKKLMSKRFRRRGPDGEGPIDWDNLSEEEAKKMLDNHLSLESELIALRQRAVQQYLEVLPARKVLMLEMADREFRRQLVNRIRRNRDVRRPRNAREGRF